MSDTQTEAESPPDASETYPGMVTLRLVFPTTQGALDFLVESSLGDAKLIEFSASSLSESDQEELL